MAGIRAASRWVCRPPPRIAHNPPDSCFPVSSRTPCNRHQGKMSHSRRGAAACGGFCVLILDNRGETCTCPPAWASCRRGWEQPVHCQALERTEDKGHCPLPCARHHPHPCPVPLTRDTILLRGIMPGRMLPPGFSAACRSSGTKKDSLYQMSNSAGRQGDGTVRVGSP